MSVPTLPLTEIGRQLLAFVTVFTVVVTLIVGLRFYAALALVKRRIRIDDWLILLAWLSTVVNSSLVICALPYGLGVPIGELSSNQISIQYKNLTFAFLTWLIATCAIKASILCLYMAIFTTNVRSFKITLYALLCVCACFFIVFLCLNATSCVPFDQAWNPHAGGYCLDTSVQQIVGVSINITLDLCIFITPLPTLWGLQLALKSKLTLSFLLCIGVINTAVMCWRLILTIQSRNPVDLTYGAGVALLATELEVWVGMLAACVPTLTPLWAAWILPLANTVVSGVRSRSGNSKAGVTDGPSNEGIPALVTAGAGDTLTTTRDAFIELEDGFMLRGDTNRHTVNVRGGSGAGGDESSISGFSDDFKEQRRSQDIQVRQEVLVTDTMGQKAYDHV